jgi:hypothetical protein
VTKRTWLDAVDLGIRWIATTVNSNNPKPKFYGRELNKGEELELYEGELKKLRDGKHNPQRIVHEKELEKYLAEGWQFVSVLPSRKILIKKH